MSKIRASRNESLPWKGENFRVFNYIHTLGEVLYFIKGSYHSDQPDYIKTGSKPIFQYMRFAKNHNAKFIFFKPGEPNALWSFENPDHPREEKFIFDILHENVANTGISPNDVAFVSGNANIQACYAGYCEWKKIPVHQQIRVKSRAFWAKFTAEVVDEIDIDQQVPITKYCSMLNRRWREQKGDLLLKLIQTGLMEPEYSDRFNKTFNFFDQLHGHNALLNDNPHMQNYFSDLPGDTAETQTLDYVPVATNPLVTQTLNECAFDFVVDYTMNEDMDTELFASYKKTFPWWTENIISEKTFRNMLSKKPFLRLGEPNSLRIIRDEYGFKTFDGILFDESYDQIQDYHKRMQALVDQLKYIMDTYTLEQLMDKIHSPQVQQVLEYNHKHFLKLISYTPSGNHPWLETYFVNNRKKSQ